MKTNEFWLKSPPTYRHLFAGLTGLLVIYVSSAHSFFYGEPLVPPDVLLDNHSMTRVSDHETPNFREKPPQNTTSWLRIGADI